jgi:hypothetical protein
MKNYLSITIASILAFSAPGIVKAQLYLKADIGGVPVVNNATQETFDGPSPSFLTLSGPAFIVTSSSNQIAQPYFSGSTAAFFGEPQANGPDTTGYVAVMVGSTATLSFSSPQYYLGLLWGSVDFGNALTFYDNANNVIGTVLGGNLPTHGGDIGQNGTFYANIASTIAFSSVVATSNFNSFEFDDVAYSQEPVQLDGFTKVVPPQVPEPASCVMFSAGLCILGFHVIRRKHGSVGA